MTPDQRRDARRWQALTLTLPSTAVDEICGHLSPITDGIECRDTAAECTEVRVFLRRGGAAAGRRFAEQVLDRLGLDPARCEPRIETVEDGRWVERYQAQLHPFDIGQRFTVLPSGAGAAGDGRRSLRLVPGRAFGTGEHPTTQLCTAALEREVRPGSRWLDVGCGTAILSIVARHCGAGLVLALDNDPEAGAVAREVLAANSVDSGVEVRVGTLEDIESRDFDGVVANISAPFFAAASADLAQRLAAGGVLIASGFIDDSAGDVEAALKCVGLAVRGRDVQAPWVVLVAERRS